MSEHIYRSHNVSALLYHIVSPAKYRRAVFSDEVDKACRDVRLKIGARYDRYYISTVGRHNSEGEIQRYVAEQGRQKEYVKLHSEQFRLF